MSNTGYNLTNMPVEDSDQPAHPRNLIRVFDRCSVGSLFRQNTDSDQTAQMRKLISICHPYTRQHVPYIDKKNLIYFRFVEKSDNKIDLSNLTPQIDSIVA